MTHADQLRMRYWLTGSVMALLAVAVSFADRSGVVSPVRAMLLDAMSPGKMVLLTLGGRSATGASGGSERSPSRRDVDLLRDALRESELQRRQLIIENAGLRQEQRKHRTLLEIQGLFSEGNGLSDPVASPSLTDFSAVRATVISDHQMTGRLRELIIDAGKTAGISRSELVVDGDGLLLDKGSESNVLEGDRVTSGAVVVGRIRKTGRWVSLVQPVTDPEFSAGVQLVRRSPDGPHFGATGILRGSDDGFCEITGIPYTEPVSAGDEIVTSEVEGVRGPRLYFGRVVAAEFLDGGQWKIRVQPALATGELTSVGIIRLDLAVPVVKSSDAATGTIR